MLPAVQHADMLDASREGDTTRGAVGEAAVGHARAGGTGRGLAGDPQPLVAQHRRFEPAHDDQQVARRSGGDAGGKGRNGDGGPHLGMRLGVADHDVGRHRVAEQRVGMGEGDDLCQRAHQGRVAPVLVGEAARQRRGIPAVPGKVEGDGRVAVAGQGHGERLHELLRAGEAMPDHHHGTGRPGGGAERGDRDAADLGSRHGEAGGRAGEMPYAEADGDEGGNGDDDSHRWKERGRARFVNAAGAEVYRLGPQTSARASWRRPGGSSEKGGSQTTMKPALYRA